MHGSASRGPVGAMYDALGRSLRLNRLLSDTLEQAVATDQTIRIGWSSSGEERPREGDTGFAPGMPAEVRILLLGRLGDFVGAGWAGASLTVSGSVGSHVAAWSTDGRVLVEGGTGRRAGWGLAGGHLTVVESTGDELGAEMSDGLIIVRGDTGDRVGHGMTGGTVVVLGDAGAMPGAAMRGGRILIGGRCPKPPTGIVAEEASQELLDEINGLLEGQQLHLGRGAMVLTCSDTPRAAPVRPEPTVSGDLSGVGLSPSTDAEAPLPQPRQVDTIVLLGNESCEAPVALPLPLLPRAEAGSDLADDAPPHLVSTSPRGQDLVHVTAASMASLRADLAGAAGIVIDLDALPSVDDVELDGLLVAISSCTGSGPVLLAGELESVERLHRLAAKVEADGVLVRVAGPSAQPAAAALPRIGRSMAQQANEGADLATLLEVPWTLTAEELAVGRAAGLAALVAPAPDHDLTAELEGVVAALGLDSIERLARRHLRARDWDTAAVSGLRLAGFDRPLPHWLAS